MSLVARPLVSVIVPAYNSEAYLGLALTSLVNQTYSNWEALVVDDGSRDDTMSLALKFAAQDSRIEVFQQENSGPASARNRGLARARGELVAFLDADDLWMPRKLEVQTVLLESENADIAYVAPSFIDHAGNSLGQPDWSRFAGTRESELFLSLQYSAQFLLTSCVMLKTRVLREAGGFDPSLRSGEDGELWLRLAQGPWRFTGTDEALCLYRSHSQGLTHQGELGFWSHMQFLPRYFHLSELDPRLKPCPFRLHFRNTFTYLGAARRQQASKAMFDAYQPYDPQGWACLVMKLLRHTLPTPAFWLVCRYFVIPLAWHLERIFEHKAPGR